MGGIGGARGLLALSVQLQEFIWFRNTHDIISTLLLMQMLKKQHVSVQSSDPILERFTVAEKVKGSTPKAGIMWMCFPQSGFGLILF